MAILSHKKALQASDITVRIIKENRYLMAYFTLRNFNNNALESSEYPALKFLFITPIFKSDNKIDKKNYRPISILPNFKQNLWENHAKSDISISKPDILSKYLYVFREVFNAHHCLITIIENWFKSLDTEGHKDALFTDLSRAFDCINHVLLITKLNTYGFDTNYLLTIIYNYLQRIKKNSSYNSFI